jgi:hydrogenase nickel incorporation protein HypA/HybF
VHELSVTQSILEITLQHAEAAGAARVIGVHLVIGDLSSYVDEAVQFYWGILAEGTIAEGSELQFSRTAAEIECLECGNQYSPSTDELACPSCEGIRVNVIAGDEFLLQDIEVELEDNAPIERE